MARILIEPSPLELGLYRDDYDALVAALKAQGHDAALEEPVEYRSVPGAEVAYDVVIRVLDVVEDHIIDLARRRSAQTPPESRQTPTATRPGSRSRRHGLPRPRFDDPVAPGR